MCVCVCIGAGGTLCTSLAMLLRGKTCPAADAVTSSLYSSLPRWWFSSFIDGAQPRTRLRGEARFPEMAAIRISQAECLWQALTEPYQRAGIESDAPSLVTPEISLRLLGDKGDPANAMAVRSSACGDGTAGVSGLPLMVQQGANQPVTPRFQVCFHTRGRFMFPLV